MDNKEINNEEFKKAFNELCIDEKNKRLTPLGEIVIVLGVLSFLFALEKELGIKGVIKNGKF